jgi:hypothetical protein
MADFTPSKYGVLSLLKYLTPVWVIVSIATRSYINLLTMSGFILCDGFLSLSVNLLFFTEPHNYSPLDMVVHIEPQLWTEDLSTSHRDVSASM